MKLLLVLIRCFKYAISPILGQNCHFYLGCTNFTVQEVTAHGALKGVHQGLKRSSSFLSPESRGFDLVHKYFF